MPGRLGIFEDFDVARSMDGWTGTPRGAMTHRNESDDVSEVYSAVGEQLFKLRSSQLRIIAGLPGARS